MKNSKVVFALGSFTDYAGEEREVVMAAVSSEIEGEVTSTPIDSFVVSQEEIVKELRLGVSVRRPNDVNDIELAKTIAVGKAMKDKSCAGKMFVTNKGFINTYVVSAFLEQEMEYFKNNPGKYLAGYDKDKKNWEFEQNQLGDLGNSF